MVLEIEAIKGLNRRIYLLISHQETDYPENIKYSQSIEIK